jgi:hypothetical protein
MISRSGFCFVTPDLQFFIARAGIELNGGRRRAFDAIFGQLCCDFPGCYGQREKTGKKRGNPVVQVLPIGFVWSAAASIPFDQRDTKAVVI